MPRILRSPESKPLRLQNVSVPDAIARSRKKPHSFGIYAALVTAHRMPMDRAAPLSNTAAMRHVRCA
jgi:hypothetical protein